MNVQFKKLQTSMAVWHSITGEWQYKTTTGSWTTLDLAQSYPSSLTKEFALHAYSILRDCEHQPYR